MNQSVPAEDTWLSATRKKDGVLNPSDPDAPITISFRAIHRELHYFDMGMSWQSTSTQNTFNAMLDEWQRQVIHLGHAWRCYNQKVDDDYIQGTNDVGDNDQRPHRAEHQVGPRTGRCGESLHLHPGSRPSNLFRAKAKLQRFWNYSDLARTNMRKIDDYVGKVQ